MRADALEFDVRTLWAQPRVKFIGNLPYNISSQLLLQFTRYPSPICLWLCMLQKEMARRLSAAPRTPDYGALTLLVQLHYRVEYLRSVPASVFLPQPEVDSAFVKITPRDGAELPYCIPELFTKLVRRGFSQRRKQLQKLLRRGDHRLARGGGGLRFLREGARGGIVAPAMDRINEFRGPAERCHATRRQLGAVCGRGR